VYYDRHQLAGLIPAGFGTFLFEDKEVGEWWGTEVQLTKQIADKHTITLGAEYRNDFRQEDTLTDLNGISPTSHTLSSRDNYGVYLEGDFELVKQLRLNAGLRYDQYGSFDPAVNPRAALIWNPVGETVFKALGGTAFRAPNFLEISDPRFPPSQPETITTYELVYEQGLVNHLHSSVSGFYNQLDDLIIFTDGRFQNVKANAKGLELSLDGSWASGLRGRASYTFQQTENTTTGQTFVDSPRHVAKLNVSVPAWRDKVFADLELQYLSRRATSRFDPVQNAQVYGPEAAGYALVNFTLFSQNLAKGLELSASVYNLLDKRYSDPASPGHFEFLIPQDGRTFRVKLTYRF
jgi:outer membrane receptor for ferrienterochelin and colicins